MQQGKPLEFNSKWFIENYGGRCENVCSPLAFSILFNDFYFIEDRLNSTYPSNLGYSLSKENQILRSYFSSRAEKQYEQYNIFETNNKFSIPSSIMEDIFSDIPERDNECYVYYLGVLSSNANPHKIILVQNKDKFYLVDPNNTNVLIYEQQEFIHSFNFKRVFNLSVLIDVDSNSFKIYTKEELNHLL